MNYSAEVFPNTMKAYTKLIFDSIINCQSNFKNPLPTNKIYSVFQSAEVQKLWVLGTHAKGKKNRCTLLA